ncbi:MAG: hypothetical protein LUC34_03360, partial [Campylobacter sp.]|nr:hypothetical protein [Campylobacter sp.]
PVLLEEALLENGFGILDFSRQDGNLVVVLDAKDAKISSARIAFEEEAVLRRFGRSYFLDTNGSSALEIISKEPNRWVPLIRIYNKNLEQIANYEEHETMYKYDIELPNDAKYVLIDDNIDINNIKNEIIVKLTQ